MLRALFSYTTDMVATWLRASERLRWFLGAAAVGVSLAAVAVAGWIGWKLWMQDRHTTGAYFTLGASLLGAAVISGAIFLGQLASSAITVRNQRRIELRTTLGLQTDLTGIDLRGNNLGGFHLRGKKLIGAQFDWANLVRANLAKADLTGASLIGARLQECTLLGAHLRNADLFGCRAHHADISMVDFTEAELGRAKLRSCFAIGCHFNGIKASGASFWDSRLHYSDFSPSSTGVSDLTGASFDRAQLFAVNFEAADLRGATFRHAAAHYFRVGGSITKYEMPRKTLRYFIFYGHQRSFEYPIPALSPDQILYIRYGDKLQNGGFISRANFNKALLQGAQMRGVSLYWAMLRGANLTGANLEGADLFGADLTDAILTNCRMVGARADQFTRWPKGYKPEDHGVRLISETAAKPDYSRKYESPELSSKGTQGSAEYPTNRNIQRRQRRRGR